MKKYEGENCKILGPGFYKPYLVIKYLSTLKLLSPRHRNAYEGINQNPTWHSSGRFFFACELDLDDSKVVNSGHNWKWLVSLSHLSKLDLDTWGKIGSQFYGTIGSQFCGKIGSIFLNCYVKISSTKPISRTPVRK